MSSISPEYYDNLKNDLEDARSAFLKNFTLAEDESHVRPLDQAYFLLETLKEIQVNLANCFRRHPSLEWAFDKEFGSFKEFTDREVLLELCFLDDYFFPELETFPIVQNEVFQPELIKSYISSFQEWSQNKEDRHVATQGLIEERLDLTHQEKDLACTCLKCIGDFRTKIREFIYTDCLKLIDDTGVTISEELEKDKGTEEIILIRNAFHEMQKTINYKLHSIRFRLKRSSLNKLENRIKSIIKSKFSYTSELGKKYVQKLLPVLTQYVTGEGFSPDFLGETEYNRFFMLLGPNIWREDKFILREFSNLVRSVLRLKRKDISAGILQEYLGQFWLHAEARKINRKIIYHMGPTNSGKTYHAIEALCKAKKGCYLAPLRLLAGEWFDTMNLKGVKTSLLTGEEVIEVEGTTHYSSTIEMARINDEFDCCVIDEIQMMSDPQRGWAWTRALIGIYAHEIHICGDSSVVELVKNIVKLTGDQLEIQQYQRLTELEILSHPIPLGSLQKADALIVFSRRNALKYKSDLEKLGFKVSIVYGRLGPEVRREQARKFDMGETDIMVSTDAIAMGMNLPIRRIVFSTLTKFVNEKEYQISDSEIKQIAGRAGRYKRFPVGYVTCLSRVDNGIESIRKALHVDLPQNSRAMVGPDLDIYGQVNNALLTHNLPILQLSEFLRLFNTMNFESPFYCVDLNEMIELTEIVEQSNEKYKTLTPAEIFGFACAPVNMGLVEHVQYFIYILNNFIRAHPINTEVVDFQSDNIDYLETSIKCVELFQWLARHFNNKHFDYEERSLLKNKGLAIERLNELLSDRVVPNCSSCGKKLDPNSDFNICEECFKARKFVRRGRYNHSGRSKEGGRAKGNSPAGGGGGHGGGGPDGDRSGRPPGRNGPSRRGRGRDRNRQGPGDRSRGRNDGPGSGPGPRKDGPSGNNKPYKNKLS